MENPKPTMIVPAILLALGILTTNGWAQNPTPFINEILPVAALPGGSGFTLTVNGTGYVSGSVVSWHVGTSTASLATTFVSTTRLTATVPASLIATAGTPAVTVVNPNTAPDEGTSNPLFFPVTDPTAGLAFGAPATPAVGTFPVAVTVGDFNGDGKLDLAVVNNIDGTASILLGNGDGTFTPAAGSPVAVGSQPTSLAVGDFNGDGKLDLAVVIECDGCQTGNVAIFLGNGDGTFSTGSTTSVGDVPESMVVGDFNGDGKLDLAVANWQTNNLTILLGNGDGTFSTGSTPAVGVNPVSLAVGDFNGDGRLDLAVANQGGSNSILLGNGDGTFTQAAGSPLAVNGSPRSVVVGDFNGDGKLDVAFLNVLGTVSILLGNGDGTFSAGSTTSVGSGSGSLAVGDLNGDGKLDLAVADQDTNNIYILLGNGDGTATAQPAVNLSSNPISDPLSVVLGDFNGDGRLDLVATLFFNNEVSILLQQPAPEVGVPPALAFGNQNMGTHNTLPVTIINSGTAALNITGVSVTGVNSADFTAALNTCSSAVSPGANCVVNVSFAPSIVGTESATLTVTDNAGTGIQTVSLTGTGLQVPQTITFNPIPTQVQGTTVALAASASSGLTVGFTSLTTSVCTVSGATATLVNSGTCTIQASQLGNNIYAAATRVSQSFTVSPAANFTITPIPPAETVYGGVLGGFILELQSVKGFNGSVTLSCSGGPTGSSCLDLPNTIKVDGTAFAVSGILFPVNTKQGTYTITFTGVSGSLKNSATATFTLK
jgi:FG-GAP-like repeat/Abnormal spindle-like microcephaly-assoc'd, ASPM-SPD-2-Hydin